MEQGGKDSTIQKVLRMIGDHDRDLLPPFLWAMKEYDMYEVDEFDPQDVLRGRRLRDFPYARGRRDRRFWMNLVMRFASASGRLDLMRWSVECGADDWSGSVYHASKGNHPDSIRWIRDTMPTDIDPVVHAVGERNFLGAVKGGHVERVREMLDSNGSDFDSTVFHDAVARAARIGHEELFRLLVDRTTNVHWNYVLGECCRGSNVNLIHHCISMGGSDFNVALRGAIRGTKNDVIRCFLNLGADDWEGCMLVAARRDNYHWTIHFFDRYVTFLVDTLRRLQDRWISGSKCDPSLRDDLSRFLSSVEVDRLVGELGRTVRSHDVVDRLEVLFQRIYRSILRVGMFASIEGRDPRILRFFRDRGFEDWTAALRIAIHLHRWDAVSFLEESERETRDRPIPFLSLMERLNLGRM